MKLSDFDYNLPKNLIAQYPSKERDESRLLVLHKDTGRIEHRIFRDIVEYLHKGDLLVLNNTRVVPARLLGRKETGGRIEALVLHKQQATGNKGQGTECEVLLKPARGCSLGSRLIFGNGELKAKVSSIKDGRRFLKFQCNGDFEGLLERLGKMPLPPYIKRQPEDSDRDRYQTIYAAKKGAVAAPTAGLHFTKDILSRISEKGAGIEYVTLHVGYGTFKPVKCEDIIGHKMEKEYFEVKGECAEKLRNGRGRTIAVGTTTCRALEAVFSDKRSLDFARLGAERQDIEHLGARQGRQATSDKVFGWTDLFIHPSYKFKAVDVLLTNFHLPRTTLLMLVSAFCGRELLLDAYKEAIAKQYRFYSYGDAMLLL